MDALRSAARNGRVYPRRAKGEAAWRAMSRSALWETRQGEFVLVSNQQKIHFCASCPPGTGSSMCRDLHDAGGPVFTPITTPTSWRC